MKKKTFALLILIGLTILALWSGESSAYLALAQTPTPTPYPTPVFEQKIDCEKLHNFCYNNWYTPTLQECQFRQEGSGEAWSFTSCECQAARAYRTCMDQAKTWLSTEGRGCNNKKIASTPLSCITPPPDDGCGLTFDGGQSNPCECDPDSPDCVSPILIDVANNGYRLTSAVDGVPFNLRLTGVEQFSWTEADSDDAWLALDRNGNGVIDDGGELFGNFTPQPDAPRKHGFLALAEFDKPANGGNGDGQITELDTVFTALRLWQDRNHNGVSEAGELLTLAQGDVTSLALDFRESRRIDKHGNLFWLRAKVNGTRFAYDVFLVRG